MNPNTKEYREKIAQQFINLLKEEGLSWKKNWASLNMCPENAINGKKYKGLNSFYLRFVSAQLGLEDLRFCTYKQAQDKGWSIKKGAKGFKVEYWMPYDYTNRKALTWKEYNELSDDKNVKIGLVAKYYTVFNAKDIEGIPELQKPELKDIKADEIIEKISKNMNVEIINDGGDKAFYRSSEDKIHLPLPGYFKDEYSYNTTALHELSHATGAEHRLNRNIKNIFGSPEYAFEELIAEISSCFMATNISTIQTTSMIENHAAYVNSWIAAIEKSPEVLMKAIKEAEKTANYLEYKAELINEIEYNKTLESSFAVIESSSEKSKYDEKIEKMSVEQRYEEALKLAGYEIIGTEPDSLATVSFKNISSGETIRVDGWHALHDLLEIKIKPLNSADIEMYNALISPTSQEIKNDLRGNGYKANDKLVDNFKKLYKQTGQNYDLREIHNIYKIGKQYNGLTEDANRTVMDIVNECKHQELAQIQIKQQSEPCI